MIALRATLLALPAFLMLATPATASSPDGTTASSRRIAVESDGHTLRDVLEQVLDGTEVSIEWRSREAADAPVRARAAGLPEEVALHLLRGVNALEFYTHDAGGPRLRRILVIGIRGQSKGSPPAKRRLRVTRAAADSKPIVQPSVLDRHIARMHNRNDRLRQFAAQARQGKSGEPYQAVASPPRQVWPPSSGPGSRKPSR